MTVKGMSTCAHCRALISTPICPICGKSVHEAVEPTDNDPIKRRMAADDRRRLIGLGTFVFVCLVVGVGAYVVLGRETPEPIPTALAAPTETTSTIRTEGDAPTVTRPDGPSQPLPTLDVGAERDVGTGTSPWRGAVPRNVLDGELLPDVDYSEGIDAVAALLAGTPGDWQLGEPASTEANGVNLAAAEVSQPFAARSVTDPSGELGDVWIFARGPRTDDGSAALLVDARASWPIDAPLDTFSPKVGVRVHLVYDDGSQAIWVDDHDDALFIFMVAAGTEPVRIGTLAAVWH